MSGELGNAPRGTGEHLLHLADPELGFEHRLDTRRTSQINGRDKYFNGRLSQLICLPHFNAQRKAPPAYIAVKSSSATKSTGA